jgi:hypothetical protein
MIMKLNAAIDSLAKAVGVSHKSTTLETAIKFGNLFSTDTERDTLLTRCNATMDRFCTFFVTGNDDVAFCNIHTRDLTFRNTWLDFLASLLTYIEKLN